MGREARRRIKSIRTPRKSYLINLIIRGVPEDLLGVSPCYLELDLGDVMPGYAERR